MANSQKLKAFYFNENNNNKLRKFFYKIPTN